VQGSGKLTAPPAFLRRDARAALHRPVRPWVWHLAGLGVFLTACAATGIQEAVSPGAGLVLAGAYAIVTSAGFMFLNSQARFPKTLLFTTAFACLSGFYLAFVAGLALVVPSVASPWIGAGLGFQVAWLLAGALLRVLPGRPSLLVVPGGRCLEACPRLRAHADVHIPLDGEVLHASDAILIDPDVPLEPGWVRLLTSELRRLQVHHVDAVIEALENRTPLEHLWHQPDPAHRNSARYDRIKRILDIGIVLCAVPLLLPLCLALALCIRLDSAGPALFRQTRVGRNGRHFRIVKFRTMKLAVDPLCEFTSTNDSRITRLGALLRRLRLDEIPQFWNVLKGDMSLVGPRPEQVPFVEKFEAKIPFYSRRHAVHPGVTGWAQINQGYVDSLDQTRGKVEYDLYYVKSRSLWLDLLILARTVPTILSGFGAR
jgi:lipopolysaccharide/colanic/teichoic acid biosynthesis glycosyltransferase